MATLRIIERHGIEHDMEGRTGLKIMEILREHDFGVAAICGGMCSCATCHVYVDPDWMSRLRRLAADERELLDELEHVRPTSSCQIEFTHALSGLRLTVAPDQ